MIDMRFAADHGIRVDVCGKLLVAKQEKWCGPACRQYGTRWKRAMRRYWEANAQAS
jgi:hypothetical protein